jgi:hypothetical protein
VKGQHALDDLIEVMNQLVMMYIARKDYNKRIWDTESIFRLTLPTRKKWQKVWNNRIQHCTPRVDQEHPDVELEGGIEECDIKKPNGTFQIKTIEVYPMRGPDIVALYKSANEQYNTAPAIIQICRRIIESVGFSGSRYQIHDRL